MSQTKKLLLALAVLIVLTPIGLITQNPAWGEWGEEEMMAMLGFVPQGIKNAHSFHAPFGDYSLAALGDVGGYVFSATLGALLVMSIFYALKKMAREQK